MRRITLIARKDFEYAGRPRLAGEVFEVSAVEAAVLCHQRKASVAPKGLVAVDIPAADEGRDGGAVAITRDDASDASADAGKRGRRRYRRRDLTAEPE
jgi:hypothetical protein